MYAPETYHRIQQVSGTDDSTDRNQLTELQPPFVSSYPDPVLDDPYQDPERFFRPSEPIAIPVPRRRPSCPRKPKTTRAARPSKAVKSGKSSLIVEGLSALTKDFQEPIRDMAAWVNRSFEARQREVDNRKGYISRPMNSFMLYRSAYADRVKKYCKENNHQVVSQVTGASWPLEPKEVRDLYEHLALVERDNHQAAFPHYKFAPNKNSIKKRTYVPAEYSDSDPNWEGSRTRRKRGSRSRTTSTRSQTTTPFNPDRVPRVVMPHYQQIAYHPSSYQGTNPHGHPPVMLGRDGMTGQYYQQQVAPYGYQVEDVKFRQMDNPFPSYDMGGGLVGLPNGSHPEMMQSQPVMMQQVQTQNDVIDPRLASMDPNAPYLQYEMQEPAYAAPQNYQYVSYGQQQSEAPSFPETNVHPGLATLTLDGHNDWAAAGYPGANWDEELRKMH